MSRRGEVAFVTGAYGFIGGHLALRLLEEGALGGATVNALATILGSFVAGLLGMLSVRLLLGR